MQLATHRLENRLEWLSLLADNVSLTIIGGGRLLFQIDIMSHPLQEISSGFSEPTTST